jgi:hypothetical protein
MVLDWPCTETEKGETNTPHLTGISKARVRSSDIIPLHLPSLKMAPEGLAVTMAQGRLSFLQQLDLSPGGSWRFLCDEPHRTLLVNAVFRERFRS